MSTYSLLRNTAVALILAASIAAAARGEERGLIGHWKLAGDVEDSSGQGNHGQNHGADLTAPGRDGSASGAVRFDGIDAFIEVPSNKSLGLGTGDFTLSVWTHTSRELDDVVGDLVSKFDPAERRGFNWCIKNGQGVVGSQANFRNIQFGIDAGAAPAWTDCGKPGNAIFVMALTVHDGQLFAGICEPGKDESGHVYRYAGDKRWIDCGSPDQSNAVTALAVHNGKLYAGTGHYKLAGSLLPNSPNTTPGGKIFRYDGDGQWSICGQLPDVEAIGGMGVYRGQLYATSMYRPILSMHRYQGDQEWQEVSSMSDGRWVYALGAFNHYLYATCMNGCVIFRFDGEKWSEPVALEPKGQSYSLEVHAGQLYTGTWPNGHVWRSRDGETWFDAGRLGEEKEVMGMSVYNGKLYAGTLPLAQVYRYDDDSSWTPTGRLDHADVVYRRAWSMALFQGKLFCGVLPSGHVHALTAGANVSHDRELEPGWRHLAAVRHGNRLKLFVDGLQVAESSAFDPSAFTLDNEQPLRIGFGENDYFCGSMSDLRLYGRALTPEEIASSAGISAKPPALGDADFPAGETSPRHEQKVAAVKNGDFDLVLIGDSITHTLGELGGKYEPTKETWTKHFASRKAINLGYSGYRTEQILWNLQNGELDLRRAPKVVMLLIGTNNSDERHYAKAHTAEEIYSGTKAIVELIKGRFPTTKILVLRIFPRGGDDEKGVSPPTFNASANCIETCRRAGELTAQLADGKQVFWLDINHVFLRKDGTINTDTMWDLLHPSPAGAEAWVQAVEPTLSNLLEEPESR